ncbi:uncharacterized protein PFLUO_LOCUS987 [Penicillium psychrofluorescens]|uniref:uncharacterized protein n=1 Tax=Penicillium psychrofluorescens TaxID=3158075 RepID=UPI003CCD920D
MTSPIDLSTGWPNPTLLPARDLRGSADVVLTTPAIADPALLYGPDEGYGPLREHVAQWLTGFYQPQDPISPQRICITGGASQNLACALNVFTDPVYTRNVWLVSPTYHLAFRTMDDAGFAGRLRAVPEDDEGIDLEFLESGLRAAEEKAKQEGNTEPKMKSPQPWRKIYKHIIYTTPTFSNPSNKIMSLRRREGLVRLARKYDALIMADDVYDMLQWATTATGKLAAPEKAFLPRLVDVDRHLDGGPQDIWGNVMSNGSFSKLIGPGARTGWAEGTEQFAYGLSQVGSSRSGGAPSQLCSAIIDQLLPTGMLQDHIMNVLQPAYAERYHLLRTAIEEHLLPRGVTLPALSPIAAGGYFIWIALPAPLQAKEIVALSKSTENLRLAPGDMFQLPGDTSAATDGKFANCLRLCFAWEEPRHLTEGVRRLARVVERAQK